MGAHAHHLPSVPSVLSASAIVPRIGTSFLQASNSLRHNDELPVESLPHNPISYFKAFHTSLLLSFFCLNFGASRSIFLRFNSFFENRLLTARHESAIMQVCVLVCLFCRLPGGLLRFAILFHCPPKGGRGTGGSRWAPARSSGRDDLDVKRLSVGATVLYIILLLLSMP